MKFVLEAACEDIKNIPGIDIVFAANTEWKEYYRALRLYMKYDCIGTPPHMPLTDVEALAVEYPRASAFIEALECSEDTKIEAKINAGERAMGRIVAGDDPEIVIREMVAEWKKACGIPALQHQHQTA